jgi:hypothetical protein
MASKLLAIARGQGVVRFKSIVSTSWLEATPTKISINDISPCFISKNVWERHLAAIFEHFEAVHNAVIGQ